MEIRETEVLQVKEDHLTKEEALVFHLAVMMIDKMDAKEGMIELI